MILYRLFFLLFCSLNSVNLYATLDLNWEYNNSGPTRWPHAFELCSSGSKQSPIDIRDDIISQVKTQIGYPDKLEFNPGPRKVRVLNNGHTIKIEYVENIKLKYGLEEYTLKQLHFPSPLRNHSRR